MGTDGDATRKTRKTGRPDQPVLTPPGSAESTGKPDPEDLSGLVLDDFKLIRRLGVGGMGQVYEAEQISLQRSVAVKMLRADLAANQDYVKRFEAEALAAAQLSHASIVQIYAVGESSGQPYITMELVKGTNLKRLIQTKGPVNLILAQSIIRQVASALGRAAEAGIVHRDIKPENILITRKGEVKVADFGLSRQLDSAEALHLTQTGVVMGTPHYMSPEQVEGKELDHRSDIYSLGVSAYHMLTGQTPYTGDSAIAVAMQHVNGKPKPMKDLRAELPDSLCRLVMKMMARERKKRHQAGKEILQELQPIRAELTGRGSAGVTRSMVSMPAAR
jgi:eukaryotic-like serine/threonine-protein kinase